MANWRLKDFMDSLAAVEQAILAPVDPALVPYRWRPLGRIELPAVWNWLEPSSAGWEDTATRRDQLRISVLVGVAPGHEQLGALEELADHAREVLDSELARDTPFGVEAVRRLGMATTVDEIGLPAQPVLCVEFPLEATLDRLVDPAP